MAAPLANLGIFKLFFVIAVKDRFDQNMNIRKLSFLKNFIIVRWVKKIFDFSHSGYCQSPISAKKCFGQNEGLPETVFELFFGFHSVLDLLSKISKI